MTGGTPHGTPGIQFGHADGLVDEAVALRAEDPQTYVRESRRTMAEHCAAIVELGRRGAVAFVGIYNLIGGAGLLSFILFNYVVIVERFNIFIFDSVRLIPGVTFAMLAGMATVVALRFSAILWGWRLPVFRLREDA